MPETLKSEEPFTPDLTTDTTPLFDAAMEALWPLKKGTYKERITNDEQGVLAAMALCLRADCTRRKVGVVIVDVHGRVVGAGRNGAPPGRPGCLTEGACPRGKLSYDQIAGGSTYQPDTAGACIANHGELNAVIGSDPLSRRGGTVYITDPPCSDCSRVLAGSGLHRAVWVEPDGEHGFVIKSFLINDAPIGGWL